MEIVLPRLNQFAAFMWVNPLILYGCSAIFALILHLLQFIRYINFVFFSPIVFVFSLPFFVLSNLFFCGTQGGWMFFVLAIVFIPLTLPCFLVFMLSCYESYNKKFIISTRKKIITLSIIHIINGLILYLN